MDEPVVNRPARGPGDPGEELPPGVSVVVPCFNSESTLEELVDGLVRVLPECAERHEIVLVNDDSRDGTWRTIRALAERHRCVRGINLMRNYGQHNATLCGVRGARYDTIVTLDDDLQHPPSEVPRLLRALDEGHDVVYGVPEKVHHSPLRRLGSWLAKYAVAVATQQKTLRGIGSFRAFRTSLRRAFRDFRSPQPLFDVLLGWGSTRMTSLPVAHRARSVGRSNYGFIQLCGAVIGLWMGYTTTPLRLASWIGFAFVVFGLGVLVQVLGRYFLQGSLPGFPFLASTIAIFGGVQLFALGIIGEYLARLFNRSMDRPAYVIKERTGDEGPA